MSLQQLVESYQDMEYSRVTRNQQAYNDTLELTVRELDRLVSMYQQGGNLQHLRLIRDSIDHWIRRYHGYTIGGSIGTHYREQGLKDKGIFEHVIPASKLRDMLLTGTLTIKQALHAPICRISSHSDLLLREQGKVSKTENYWLFFKRYKDLDCTIETHDGTKIDLETWTLQDHYKQFGV